MREYIVSYIRVGEHGKNTRFLRIKANNVITQN
jgi:hypothetical protein